MVELVGACTLCYCILCGCQTRVSACLVLVGVTGLVIVFCGSFYMGVVWWSVVGL